MSDDQKKTAAIITAIVVPIALFLASTAWAIRNSDISGLHETDYDQEVRIRKIEQQVSGLLPTLQAVQKNQEAILGKIDLLQQKVLGGK